MAETHRAGGAALPTGLVVGSATLAGVAAGGSLLLRRFDAWALDAITRPPRREMAGTPADFGLAYDEVRLRSEDAVDLIGWLIQAPGGPDRARGTIILGHGHSDTMGSLLGIATWIQAEGYNVFLLDFRAHGRSGGIRTSVGYLEHQDVAAALRYLGDRRLGRVGIMGWSLGGAVAVVSGAIYPQIAGVIADSTFARLASPLGQAAQQVLHYGPGIAKILGWYGERLVARSLGFNVTDARPEELVGRISPRPLLIIHSETDEFIPVANAHTLYARAGEPKELWISPGGEHNVSTVTLYPDEYRQRVLAFWDRVFPAVG